jgi:hypothetical protein
MGYNAALSSKVNVSEEHIASILRLEEWTMEETDCEVNDRNKWTYLMQIWILY